MILLRVVPTEILTGGLHAAKLMGLRAAKSLFPTNMQCTWQTTRSKINGTTCSKIIIRKLFESLNRRVRAKFWEKYNKQKEN